MDVGGRRFSGGEPDVAIAAHRSAADGRALVVRLACAASIGPTPRRLRRVLEALTSSVLATSCSRTGMATATASSSPWASGASWAAFPRRTPRRGSAGGVGLSRHRLRRPTASAASASSSPWASGRRRGGRRRVRGQRRRPRGHRRRRSSVPRPAEGSAQSPSLQALPPCSPGPGHAMMFPRRTV